MNWEWCSIFPSHFRLFPQSYNKINSWKCCTRELNLPALERGSHCLLRRSSSRNTRIWATGLRERSVRQTQTRACSSHLHFTPKQRGSVTLWVFTDSQIEVTNRESILSWILSGFLSGMAALINGHQQLGWGKKKNSASRATGSTLCLPAWHATNCRDFGWAASAGSLFGDDWRCFSASVYFTGNLI